MRLVAEGGSDGVPIEQDIRFYAVNTYLELLKKPVIPDIMYQVAFLSVAVTILLHLCVGARVVLLLTIVTISFVVCVR